MASPLTPSQQSLPAENPTTTQVARKRSSVVLALPALVLALACLLPFLNKAYLIDDPLFLLEARQILKTPLDPWSYPLCWNQTLTCFPQAGTSGANVREGLLGYALLPVILGGGAEWIAHLIQLVFVCWAVLFTVKLARRLGMSDAQAAAGGLLLVAIPPLLSMADTAMPDVLALALVVTGMERLLAWKEERRWSQAICAGVALGLAPYARPHMVVFLGVCALWLFREWRVRGAVEQLRREFVVWIPLVVAGVILASVNYVTRLRGAESEIVVASATDNIPLNLIAYFHYLSFPIPLAAVWLLTQWRRTKMLLVPPLIPVVFAHFMVSGLGWLAQLEIAAVLYGLVAFLDLLVHGLRGRDQTGTLLALWLLIPLAPAVYLHLPLKYFVPVLPAIVLLLLRATATLPKRREVALWASMILLCTGYSLLLLRADTDFADYGRRAVAELIAPRIAAGEKVWYAGEWGFYWYADRAGARVVKPGKAMPAAGDLVAVGLMENGDVVLKELPNRELVDVRKYDSPHGRTMGYGAGLYSNRFGLLAWRWNPGATNEYQLWRIK